MFYLFCDLDVPSVVVTGTWLLSCTVVACFVTFSFSNLNFSSVEVKESKHTSYGTGLNHKMQIILCSNQCNYFTH